ncbi:hypothetical protein EXIGLDRAFT_697470 [Exidia glandulosa HHB12029]|uniref:Endonuclease/exonuclease/phosphatase domain-containing protein n=1 Tax=Exidia glandulosa HHB12029 TaxID=1314781 RepID=A0A165ES62_EXIGL|nr:hypothetical protein EXIGLDRAFT_697470 [Exidia glandulosa HHB12029]
MSSSMPPDHPLLPTPGPASSTTAMLQHTAETSFLAELPPLDHVFANRSLQALATEGEDLPVLPPSHDQNGRAEGEDEDEDEGESQPPIAKTAGGLPGEGAPAVVVVGAAAGVDLPAPPSGSGSALKRTASSLLTTTAGGMFTTCGRPAPNTGRALRDCIIAVNQNAEATEQLALSTALTSLEKEVALLKAEVARLAGMAAVHNAVDSVQLPALPIATTPAQIVPIRRPVSPSAESAGDPKRFRALPPALGATPAPAPGPSSHPGLCIGPCPAFSGMSPWDLLAEVQGMLNCLPGASGRRNAWAVVAKENNQFVNAYFHSVLERDGARLEWPPAGAERVSAVPEDNLPPPPPMPAHNAQQAPNGHMNGFGVQRGAWGQRGTFMTKLGILAWNIAGQLELKMEDEKLLDIFSHFEVVLLQETHLLPSQHESLRIPDDFVIYSCPRPFPPNLGQQWGGVLALVHRTVEHTFRADLSSPDILVLDVAGFCIINAYLPPRASPAMTASDPNPVDRFIATLAACCARRTVPVMVVLDANARTGNLQAAAWAPRRLSVDARTEPDPRGRELVRVFSMHDLGILNGMISHFPLSGSWTSKQFSGTSVIDYAVCLAEQPAKPAYAAGQKSTGTASATVTRYVRSP